MVGSQVSLNTVAWIIMIFLLRNELRLFNSYPVSLHESVTLADAIFPSEPVVNPDQWSSKEYTIQLCTIALDLTSRSGFATAINVIRTIKSRRIRWTGCMAFLGQIRSAYAVLVREGFFRNHITKSCIYFSKHLDKLYLINLKDHLCLFERAYLK